MQFLKWIYESAQPKFMHLNRRYCERKYEKLICRCSQMPLLTQNVKWRSCQLENGGSNFTGKCRIAPLNLQTKPKLEFQGVLYSEVEADDG